MSTAYANGEFVSLNQAGISIFDRGLLYGDGLFATIKVENGIPIRLQAHLKRLADQCEALNILMPLITVESVEKLIALNSAHPVMRLRIVVTAGEQTVYDLSLRQGYVFMGIQPYEIAIPPHLRMALFSKPLELVHAHYKTLANFNRFWIVDEAKKRGFDDGISVSSEGFILEASFGNLFWIVDDTVYIPSKHLPYYLGVTLTTYLTHTSYKIQEVCCSLEQIPQQAQIFRANTMSGIVPIIAIEDRAFTLPLVAT